MSRFLRARITLLILLALVAYPVLASCVSTPGPISQVPLETPAEAGSTTQSAGEGNRTGGTFIDVSYGDAVTMQPLLSEDSASGDRIGLVYASLLTYDQHLQLVGALAKSYNVGADMRSISFDLREDAVWSDGTPITADDVKFTWDKMMDENTKFPYRSLYAPLGELEVTGPKSFVFHLRAVFAPALDYAGGITPIPRHIFEELDINENEANDKPPVSSGPFIFKEWVRGDHATFVANDRYYDGRPNIDTYVFRVVKDANVSYEMLKTGGADFSTIEPLIYNKAKNSSVFRTYRYYSYAAAWDYIGFNMRNPILADKLVRQALSCALDKQKMIDRLLLGFAKRQYSIYPATSPVFTDDVPRFDYDVNRAKALLEQAGWTTGPGGIREKDGQKLKLRVEFNAGNKRREQIATVAQQYWKQVGVDVEVDQEEWGAFLRRVNETHDFDMIILGWAGGYEPSNGSNIWMTGTAQNSIGYSDPLVDELFQKAITVSYDMKERKPIYVEIQQIIAEDQPYIFLFTGESLIGVNRHFQGIDPDPLGLRWNVEKWSFEAG